MITKQNFFIIVILGLVGIIILQQMFPSKDSDVKTVKIDGKKYEMVKHEIDTIEVVKTKTEYKQGENIYYETIVHDTTVKYIAVDTNAILRDYFAKNIYKDLLVLPDGLGTVAITDTIYKNKIQGRKWIADVKERVVKETMIVKEPARTQIYVGVNAYSGNQQGFAGPHISLKTKKDNIYGMNMLMDADGNKYYGFNLAWKIKLKK